ncbi:hypothetical protein M408DRAFT_26189 [Serendipita vermifera MAFF 305830]|uniref:Crinkler effector protein N-terminal domain-containing protein n=1 Tax=Serendipita vermifera MAFF 305830 TaxID=933852 RepID=A0A0C2WG48_SERVB|nr:hypothetical protein M408DRAFT_26189 [Serendipita vermifera MAFF 305830]
MSNPKPEIYIVNCFVLDEECSFSVEIASDEFVDILKDEIKAKIPNRFPNIPACFMKLYLFNISDGYDLVARVGEQKPDNALKAWWTMAEVFGGTPKPNAIHILAKPPRLERKRDDLGPASTDWSSVKEWGPLSSLDLVKIDDTIARRTSTVDALYERLKRYQFVLVRGTRASGKTTLAQLLKDHICAKEPTVVPILIDYWIRDIGWRTNLTPSFKPDGQNTIIIDDAQLTY